MKNFCGKCGTPIVEGVCPQRNPKLQPDEIKAEILSAELHITLLNS